MSNTCIVVADRARARFFELAAPPENRPEDPAKLVERETLVDPEGEMTGGQLSTDTRSGTNHAGSGASYEYDEHHERRREEVARRFAKRLAASAGDFARNLAARRLVLVAEPHMLGLLRAVLPPLLPKDVDLVELARDLTWHTPEHIQSALRKQGLLGPVHSGKF